VSINRKKLGALLGVVAIGIAVASTAGAARQSTPGVTATKVTIGGTFPLSGPASLYATIAGAEQAYYGYVNAHGGVNGRKITDIVLDDQYDPSQTLGKDKKLVEQDHVFAVVGSLGTAPGLATWNYLNKNNVPQALLATGDAYWGTCAASPFKPKPYCPTARPWTIGWQPDYPSEARQYASYILANKNSPKIGILYQNDAYGQNYRSSFLTALGSHKSDVVSQQGYNYTDSSGVITGHVAALAAHGANTVVIFATPAASIAALATITGLTPASWGGSNPLTLLNNVSANRVFLLAAQGSGANVNNVISTTYIKSQSATPSNPAMQLGKAIIYATKNAGLKHQWDLGDNNLVYGLAVAWTFVDALKHAGANPTRTSLMKALRSLNETGANKNPFIFDGMDVKTSSIRTFPMQQLEFETWKGQTNSCNPSTGASCGDWRKVGSVLNSGH
jgi:branched-chain amino acid transport system substrate-binding protein